MLRPEDPYPQEVTSALDLPRRLMVDPRVRYLLCGSAVALIYLGTFTGLELTAPRWGYVAWFSVAQVVAISVAFPLYRTWVFASRGSLRADALRFGGVWGTSLVLSAISLPLLVELVGLDPAVAQLLAVVCSAGWSYVGHRFVTFRQRH